MGIKVTKGIIRKPLKLVVYGPEGIGKTTFASQFPWPVFIDTEGSTNHMDVARFEAPKTWDAILEDVKSLIAYPAGYQTLVLDTADWAVRMCETAVCMRAGKAGIEDFGYGKGYVYAKEEFGKLLDLMTEVVEKGINVVLTAHSIIRKFERPDESGAYDRWELKLGNKAGSQIAALCKEWADVVLFANYKETVVEIDGKKKAQGGSRVMYTSHAPTWDAKNRHGMPPELPFDYTQIAQIVPEMNPKGISSEELHEEPHRPKASHDMYLYHKKSGKYFMVKTGEELPDECINNGPCYEMNQQQWEMEKRRKAEEELKQNFDAKPVSNKKAKEIEDVKQDMEPQNVADHDMYMYHGGSDSYYIIKKGETVTLDIDVQDSDELDKEVWEERRSQQQKKAAKDSPGKDQTRDGVDPRILQLCDSSNVSLNEISKALQEMGQAPGFFPVREFPPQIMEAVVAHWQEILNHINENAGIPF